MTNQRELSTSTKTQNRTILIIEDNPDILENTSELLELEGYRTLMASAGKDGVRKAIKELPDVIISDIRMPETDGYEVLNLLNSNPKTSKIPFIFVTALAEKKEKKLGLDLGADDYLVKPFYAEDLMKCIEECLKKKEILDEVYEDDLDELNDYIRNRRFELIDSLAS